MFLAMDLIRGETLADRMRVRGITAPETVSLLTPIADALDFAHDRRVVHRDVKPENIMIGDGDHPYLADFGIAKRLATSGFTATSGFIGSYNYAPPEQIRGLPVTPASDVYALAAVLYHCITGRRPYVRDTDAAVLHAHVFEPPPEAASGQPGADQFNSLIARGMAKNPEARFESATEMLRDASGLVEALPAARRTISPAIAADSPTRTSADAHGYPICRRRFLHPQRSCPMLISRRRCRQLAL